MNHTIPVSLTSALGNMYSPVLSIYFDGDTSDITLNSGGSIVLAEGGESVEINLVGRSTSQVVGDINKVSLHYTARVMTEVDDLGSITLTTSTSDLTIDGGQLIRSEGHTVQRLEQTQIRLLPPYNDSRYDPFYVLVNPGWVQKTYKGNSWWFTVPEYYKQAWSRFHGRGHIDLEDVIAQKVGPKAIAVPRTPILWKSHNVLLKVKDVVQSSSTIREIDVNNGIIYLNKNFDENETILVDYTYTEDNYPYDGIDLNPTEFHNPGILDKYVLIYLLPFVGPDGILRDTCIRHIESSTVLGAIQSIPDTGEPIMILGTVQVRQVYDINDAELIDTRTRGGGVKLDSFDSAVKQNREVLSVTDRGFYDGKPYPGNMTLIMTLPEEIKDTFERAEIDELVYKFTAMGTHIFLEFE